MPGHASASASPTAGYRCRAHACLHIGLANGRLRCHAHACLYICLAACPACGLRIALARMIITCPSTFPLHCPGTCPYVHFGTVYAHPGICLRTCLRTCPHTCRHTNTGFWAHSQRMSLLFLHRCLYTCPCTCPYTCFAHVYAHRIIELPLKALQP